MSPEFANAGSAPGMKIDPAKAEARGLWTLIGQVSAGLYRVRENELRPLGIPIMHSAALWALRVLDRPAAPAEISRMLGRRHQAVLQLLSRMEKQGSVSILRGSHKGGPVRVTMTDKGRRIVDLAWEKEEVMAETVSCLSQDERDTLREFLVRLRDKASEIAARPTLP
jgi:DNA-binding MarR family transcriptional regulator